MPPSTTDPRLACPMCGSKSESPKPYQCAACGEPLSQFQPPQDPAIVRFERQAALYRRLRTNVADAWLLVAVLQMFALVSHLSVVGLPNLSISTLPNLQMLLLFYAMCTTTPMFVYGRWKLLRHDHDMVGLNLGCAATLIMVAVSTLPVPSCPLILYLLFITSTIRLWMAASQLVRSGYSLADIANHRTPSGSSIP
ncbi:MAG: hypothetical protein C0478_15555 [Planctomyces sp.]|nr:hypothetical protein [Planctomyces sp.]